MKKILSLALLLSVTASAFAVEEEINGLWYELISKTKEATVIQYKNNVQYRGDIVIPKTVEYNGTSYSVTSIGGYAFYNCSGMTSVTIPNSVTSIGNDAFYNCSGLTSVTIGNSVTSIGYEAFRDCSGLTSIAIPNSVTSIGSYAFYNCSGLTSVTIGNGVTSIGDYAFDFCRKLTSVHISDIAAWCNIAFGNYSSNPARHIFIGDEEIKDLVIPNSVTSIGKYAFQYCIGLTSVTISNNVTSIGQYAFEHCSGLTSVTIGNSLESIGEYAFGFCSGLTSVYISDIAAWCTIDFNGSSSNPLGYAQHLFIGDEEIKDLIIPNSVKYIGPYAFQGCDGLTSVTIPNSVKCIWEYAFSGCNGLTSVTIPNSVKYIWDSAFSKCSALTTITIGSGVETIGSYAFGKCPELADVYCYAGTVPSIKPFYGNPCTNAFEDSYINFATLYVPTASIDAYKAVEPWKSFKTIMGLDETIPEEPETPKCATPTISFDKDGLVFSCETPDVDIAYEITDSDIRKGFANSNKVSLTPVYTITYYAMKAGYENSDVATATIRWRNGTPVYQGFTKVDPGEGAVWGDLNIDGTVDVADIANIIDIMAR